MQTIRTLLALHESQHKWHGAYSQVFKDLDYWQGADVTDPEAVGLTAVDCEVHYDFEHGGHTDHPYGSTTAREYHGDEVNIMHVVTMEDADVYDEDGDKVVGKIPAGTDLMAKSWWQDKWTEHLAENIDVPDGDDDFDEPWDDDREGDYHDDYMSRHN